VYTFVYVMFITQCEGMYVVVDIVVMYFEAVFGCV